MKPQADIVHVIKHIVLALQPIAKAEDIDLTFSSAFITLNAVFLPNLLANDITTIICKMIDVVPEHEKISVSIEIINDEKCKIIIANTGIDLTIHRGIASTCRLIFVTIPKENNSTQYEIEVDLADNHSHKEIVLPKISPGMMPGYYYYYSEVDKRLRSHFTKAENLLEVLSVHNPRDAAFLRKVNELIISNMENSQFDANHLSDGLHLSRTQLFRRLKPIIQQSPGNYIRTIKLQKAKELLETTDMLISEVAYKTGFETASYFAKVFTKQYGLKPSVFCRKKPNATNE